MHAVLQCAGEVAHARDVVTRAPVDELVEHAVRRARIAEVRGTDRDRARAREQHLDRVDAGLHTTGADHGNVGQRARHRVHRAQRDRFDRGTRQSPTAAAEHRPAGLGVDHQREDGVHQGEAVGPGVDRGPRDLGEIGHIG